MTETTGQNINFSDTPTTPLAIAVGSTTAVTLIPAPVLVISPWRWVSIYNSGNQTLWLRFYAATQDNLKIGTPLFAGEKMVIQLPNMPSTEISGIMGLGGLRDVVVQYF